MSAVGSAAGRMAQQVLTTGVSSVAPALEQAVEQGIPQAVESIAKKPLSCMGTLRAIGSFLYGWGKYLLEGGMGLVSKVIGVFRKAAPAAEDAASFQGAHI